MHTDTHTQAQTILPVRRIVSLVLKSLKQYRLYAAVTPFLVLIEIVVEVCIPFVTAGIINAIAQGSQLGDLMQSAALLITLSIMSLIAGTLAGYTGSIAAAGLAKNLRYDLFAAIQEFSFSNIDRFSTSSLVTRLTSDVVNVQMAFMMIIRMAVRSPLMAVFAIIMAFLAGGRLGLLYIVLAFVLIFVLVGFIHHVMPVFHRMFKQYDKLNALIEENVSGIRVVKACVRERFEEHRFVEKTKQLFDELLHIERCFAWTSPLFGFSINIIYLFIVYYGSQLVVQSQGQALGIGSMSALITYGFSMLMALMMFSMVIVMISMSKESAQRICEVLLEKSDLVAPGDPVFELADASIDFCNVSFEYEKHAQCMALQDINLHIASGETIGIVGGTGSSKSTLVQLINRLYDVSKGELYVGGVNVRNYDLASLRDQVAVVLQRNVLFSGTIAQNLRWGNPQATDEELVEVCKLAQADDFIQKLEQSYDSYVEQGGANFSGGQRQRLCIARALLKKPKILIFDDSTSAVDTKTDKLIRRGLASAFPHTTKLIIASRTSCIEDATRIIVMRDGRIDAIGSHEQLLRGNDIYREMYISQNKLSHDQKMHALEASEHEHEEDRAAEKPTQQAANTSAQED